jgi:hypothetical protein
MAQTNGTGAGARQLTASGAARSEGAARSAGEGDRELLAQVTPENGGLVSGPDGGLAVGNPESQRIYDDAIARGAVPPPKGPPPIRRAPSNADRASVDRAGTGQPNADHSSTARREPSPPRRAPVATRIPAPTGPATPDDAWKWEGVPPGRSLIGPVEPGKLRHYMGDDGHGPCIKWLPAVWPPGQEPEA